MDMAKKIKIEAKEGLEKAKIEVNGLIFN